jgi:hypothetical protein
VTRIAVSGHRGLSADTARLISEALRAELAAHQSPVTGLCCLADGVDHVFARTLTDLGGRLEAVIPAERYREMIPAAARPEYDDLLGSAAVVHQMACPEPTDEALLAASVFMLSHADQLYAVWDGMPARGRGGTADVVAQARELGIPTKIIWPEGATRD